MEKNLHKITLRCFQTSEQQKIRRNHATKSSYQFNALEIMQLAYTLNHVEWIRFNISFPPLQLNPLTTLHIVLCSIVNFLFSLIVRYKFHRFPLKDVRDLPNHAIFQPNIQNPYILDSIITFFKSDYFLLIDVLYNPYMRFPLSFIENYH